MATPSQRPKPRNTVKNACVATIVQVVVLVWSAAVLTAGWVGMAKNADTTFVAGIFTSVLSNFGVQAMKRREEENTIKTPRPKPPAQTP